METVNDAFKIFREGLAELYDTNEIEALTLVILNEITGISKAGIKAFPEHELTAEHTARLSNILNHLQTGKPLQYILGQTEFFGLTFQVNSSVLIPRPETEELVEWVLTSVSNGPLAKSDEHTLNQLPTPDRQVQVLDIGTGSGCIAISLKKNLPQAQVSAVDVSPEALKTAKANALLNHVKIDFIEADILNVNHNHALVTNKYSIIVSNPPYVTPADKKQMHRNVTDFEPHTALFVSQENPLVFYIAIADFALKTLQQGGLLFFEINESYGKQTVDMLADKSFKNIELRKDISGRDRMIKATI